MGELPESQMEAVERLFSTRIAGDISVEIVTREQCDAFARRLLDADVVRPVNYQGTMSYTTFSPSVKKEVQFRLQPLDNGMLSLAFQAYGDTVPQVTSIQHFALPVYISAFNPGHLHIFQTFPEHQFPLERQKRTVQDVARFIARGATLPLPRYSLKPGGWTLEAGTLLQRIIDASDLKKLEPRYAARAATLLSQLHLLDKLPPVITNQVFAELNIMVEPDTGALTGVLDFDGARIEAFGMCIFGVYESFFGRMYMGEWRWFEQKALDGEKTVRQVLEAAFWHAFWENVPLQYPKEDYEDAVKLAVEIGMINRYVTELLDGIDENNEQCRMNLEWSRGVWLGADL